MKGSIWGIFKSMDHKTPRVYCDSLETAEKFLPEWKGHVLKEMTRKPIKLKKLLKENNFLPKKAGSVGSLGSVMQNFSEGDKFAFKTLEDLWSKGQYELKGFDLALVYKSIWEYPGKSLMVSVGRTYITEGASDCSIVLMKELGYKIDYYGEVTASLFPEEKDDPPEIKRHFDPSSIKGKNSGMKELIRYQIESGTSGVLRDSEWAKRTQEDTVRTKIKEGTNTWTLMQLFSPHRKEWTGEERREKNQGSRERDRRVNVRDDSRGHWEISGLSSWLFLPWREKLFNKGNVFYQSQSGLENFGRYDSARPLPCEMVFRMDVLPCTIDFWFVLDKPTPTNPRGTISFDTPEDLLEVDGLDTALTETIPTKELMEFIWQDIELAPMERNQLPSMMRDYYSLKKKPLSLNMDAPSAADVVTD